MFVHKDTIEAPINDVSYVERTGEEARHRGMQLWESSEEKKRGGQTIYIILTDHCQIPIRSGGEKASSEFCDDAIG